MAGPSNAQKPPRGRGEKLARLPSNAKVTKRPLLRPAIPSAHASDAHPKVIYLSTRTAFIPTVKRVQSLLGKVEERSMQSLFSKERQGGGVSFAARVERTIGTKTLESEKNKVAKVKTPKGEEVLIKATGKAIEKALSVALFFQKKDDMNVRLQTGTVSAIDDIEITSNNPEEDEDLEVPETRIRQLSMIQVAISLR